MEGFNMYVFICLFAVVLCYFYIENRINRACLASFRAVIHVNGIRGKTSTCRLIDAADPLQGFHKNNRHGRDDHRCKRP